jgi:hypothetical protein
LLCLSTLIRSLIISEHVDVQTLLCLSTLIRSLIISEHVDVRSSCKISINTINGSTDAGETFDMQAGYATLGCTRVVEGATRVVEGAAR